MTTIRMCNQCGHLTTTELYCPREGNDLLVLGEVQGKVPTLGRKRVPVFVDCEDVDVPYSTDY